MARMTGDHYSAMRTGFRCRGRFGIGPVFAILVLTLALLQFGHVLAAPEQGAASERIHAFAGTMAQQHGFDADALVALLSGIEPRQSILRAMKRPATKRPWYEFRERIMSEQRITAGVEFWDDNASTLSKAQQQFGVPASVIVATLGVESMYGRRAGNFPVLDALTTLAFYYPPRADYFGGELEAFLLLARQEKIDPRKPLGSYAGAMGAPQFMPDSYRKYAVDFDGDGSIDLDTPADAIGSVANYYRHWGWDSDKRVAVRAQVTGNDDVDALIEKGIKPHTSIARLAADGVRPLQPVDDTMLACVFSLQTRHGEQYWLGLNNFYVITRYNRSTNYAMVVRELSNALRNRVEQAGK
jgi:membrane-bound lytic murein transglycosylase B